MQRAFKASASTTPAGTAGSPRLLVPAAHQRRSQLRRAVRRDSGRRWAPLQLGPGLGFAAPFAPCLNGQAVHGQALALGGVVDVPAASTAGLLTFAVLAAAGALWMLQALRRG